MIEIETAGTIALFFCIATHVWGRLAGDSAGYDRGFEHGAQAAVEALDDAGLIKSIEEIE